MDTPLLQTKLYTPPVRTHRVARQRLHARLDPLLQRKLGVISAPAGYGKTTLVADWLDRLAERRDIVVPQTAWLSLDEQDNDPARFFGYVVAALQEAYPQVGRSVQAVLSPGSPAPLEPLLIALINDLAATPTQCVLLLDDYHLIDNQTIHEALDFFVDHLPPQLHLLIATRSVPPLALDRLRVRDDLIEVDQTHLAFNAAEADALIERIVGAGLPEDQVTALIARTEGWAAGLQLAALSLRDTGQADRERFVNSFSGSHHHVAGFLHGEAFSRQSESVQTFLLHTSVLEKFCGSLCDALLSDAGISGSQMLDRLETSDLFLVPLDREHKWYRYHHLFRDLLRDRIGRDSPDLIPELHLRASQWFASEGQPYEAIEQALTGSHYQQAAALIDGLGCRFTQEGSDKLILRWVAAIPPALHRLHPWLRVAQLNALCGMERYDELAPLLDSLEADVGLFPGLPIAACVVLVRAWCAMRTGYDSKALLTAGIEALALLAGQLEDEGTRLLRSAAHSYVGHGHWNLGHRDAAQRAFEATVRDAMAASSVAATVRGLGQLARFFQAVGPLRRCAETCEQGIEIAERAWAEHAVPAPPAELVANLEGLLALMLLLWGRFDEAEAHARRSVELFELSGSQPGHSIEYGLINLAWVHCAKGEPEKALALLRRMDRMLLACSQEVNWQIKPKLVRLRLAMIHQFPGQRSLLSDVEAWVSQAHLDPDDPEHNQVRSYEALTNALLALGRPKEAIPWLRQGVAKTKAQGWILSEMLLASWLAVAHQQVGNTEEAVEAMARSLALAEPEGCMGLYTEWGPHAYAVLRSVRSALPSRKPPFDRFTPEFVDAVMADFPPEHISPEDISPEDISPENQAAGQREASPLIEPLSEREMDVLQLVARGLRNRQIAGELYVTANTVGFHLKNIYGKLDAHSRTEAVATARELQLIA